MQSSSIEVCIIDSSKVSIVREKPRVSVNYELFYWINVAATVIQIPYVLIEGYFSIIFSFFILAAIGTLSILIAASFYIFL